MKPHSADGRVVAACMLAALAGCRTTGIAAVPAEPSNGGADEPPRLAIVAAVETIMWSGQGGKGTVRAALHQGVQLTVPGGDAEKEPWIAARTSGKLAIAGWVARTDIGCRIASDIHLLPSAGASEKGDEPLARRGALVRILARTGVWLVVETAPDPLTWYEKGPSDNDPVLARTDFGGYIVEGWIPEDSCTIEVKPFWPKAPQDGELFVIEQATSILATAGGISNALGGKILPMTRWVTLETSGLWVRGRTDGQVVVSGWIPISVLGPPPNTNPLNKLAEHNLKDYEIVASVSLEDGKGNAITELPGGQELSLLSEEARGCKVKTPPPIEIEGWIECELLRNISILPEAMIEYGMIDGAAGPSERGPWPNPLQ